MKTYVIGDIHGAYKALKQVFERSPFDPEKDQLIFLGDVADGWSEVPECVELLMTCKNLIAVRGNHDWWCWEWMQWGIAPQMWLPQGGQVTHDAYKAQPELIPKHREGFFSKQVPFYHDKDNDRVYVHGGYVDPGGIGHDDADTYMWDRELWHIAMSGHASMRSGYSDQRMPRRLRPHKEIFVGHTSTTMWVKDTPMNKCNVWNLDTGAGWDGKLSIMDVESKEFWQSDKTEDLYPEGGRKRRSGR